MRTDNDRRAALRNLPPDLTGTYKQLLDEIAQVPNDLTLVWKAFIWLLFVPDRFTLSDLVTAVAIDPDEGFSLDRRLSEDTELLELCGPLLRYSPVTRTVEFGHFSVVQYLLSPTLPSGGNNTHFIDTPDSKSVIARCCRSAYASKEGLGTFGPKIGMLWDYLAWSIGVQYIPMPPLQSALYFENFGQVFFEQHNTDKRTADKHPTCQEIELHRYDLQSLYNGFGDTVTLSALEQAVNLAITQNGSVGIIIDMLSAKASLRGENVLYDPVAFQLSVRMGRKDLVERLYTARITAEPTKPIASHQSLPFYPVSQQVSIQVPDREQNLDPEMAEILVDRARKEWREDDVFPPPIVAAAGLGRVGVVEILLDMDDNVGLSVTHWQGTTALHLACFHKSPDILQALLTTQLDINAQNSLGYTSLHVAVVLGRLEAANALLSRCDLEIADLNGLTALHHAARVGNKDITKALLLGGAKETSSKFGTPSEIALNCQRYDVIPILAKFK
jgi:hypothetical protein